MPRALKDDRGVIGQMANGEPAGGTLPSWRSALAAWLFGLLLLAAVITFVIRAGELEEFARLLHELRFPWLIAAFSLQALTYVCAAAVWQLALAHEGQLFSVPMLIPMTLAMLFANQAFPSAGVSGSLVVVRALRRRNVPSPLAIGALLIDFITACAALFVAVGISVVLLRVYHAVNLTLLLASGAFALAAIGVPALLIWYRESIASRFPAPLKRLPAIGSLLKAAGTAPSALLHDRPLVRRAVAIQLLEIMLDACTLLVMLIALGTFVAPSAVFGSLVMASAVSRVVPVPLGLGTFEASLVGMLRVVGVSLEAALTATLLLRGFTLWLPMLPGLWYARRELWPARA